MAPKNKSDEELYAEYLKYLESEGQAPIKEEVTPDKENTALETLSDVAVSIPQGITTWADEIQAAAQAGGKKLMGAPEELPQLYEQEVGGIRERLGKARERSPWASTAAEMGTGIATSFLPVLGTGKLATSAGGMIGRGAFEGLGTAEDKASIKGAVSGLMGAGAGAVGAGVSGALKKGTTAEPNVIRAGVLGARTAEMQEVGRKSREELAGKMKEMGMFSPNKVVFDPDAAKFKPAGKLKSLESLEKPTQDKLLKRTDDALKEIQNKKKPLMAKFQNDPIDLNDLDKTLDDAALEWAKKATGVSERYDQAIKLKDTILNDILQESSGFQAPTIGHLEAAKVRLGKDTANWGKSELLKNIPDIDDLYMDMYTTMNKKLRSIVPDKNYAKFNDMQSDFLTVKRDLTKAIASGNVKSPTFRNEGLMSRAMSALSSGEETALGAANIAELLQKPLVKPAVTGARLFTQEAPSAAMRFIDPSIPRGNYREPQSEGIISPMEVVKYKIPRTTDGILANKRKVIAKLVQNGVPDQMVETITHALNEDQDAIAKVTPLLISQMPALFERSKYHVFDGKFLGGDGAKAADDISRRDDLNSIQKAKMIDMINKSNKVPEGL